MATRSKQSRVCQSVADRQDEPPEGGHHLEREILCNREAFDACAREETRRLVGWVQSCWPGCDAQAVVAAAFERSWARRDELICKHKLSLRAYVRTVVRNEARRQSERGARQSNAVDQRSCPLEDENALPPDVILVMREQYERLHDAICSPVLSDDERTIVGWRLAGRCYGDFAEIRGVPAVTARSWHLRALQKLRSLLGDGAP